MAMLLDIPYEESCATLSGLGSNRHGGDWDVDAVSHIDVDRVLAERGWFHQRRYKAWAADSAWPPEPFAPIHYACVTQPSNNYHLVVMLEDGTVLDPMREGEFTLADWSEVSNVCGLLPPGAR